MAMKYSDFITIRESKPAYNISNEEKGEWETFIPNAQFNEILRRVISAVRNNDQDAHKSFWIDGTYGTGKSHAAAVIKHLLCDNVEDIREYVDVEYAAHRFDLLRQSIYDLRQTKRLFPVNLYGPEGISRKEDFSHRLQSAIKKALKAAGITSFYVKTDFDDYANHVESEPAFWEDIIAQSPKLEAYTPDVKTLASKLRSADTSILTQVKEALAERRMDIRLDSANICDWFFEIQDKLAENTDFSGLLIIWDEFTDLMKSDIGPSLLVELQNITERAMETCNNSYFFFISHPSALNKLDAQERTKTTGRYHYMKYNMETVSAFKIMSRKFRIINTEGYNTLTADFFNSHEGMLSRYAKDSNNVEDTDKDVALDDKHIEEAAIYIKQHLQGEVGLWSENEVNMQLLRWKASLTPKPTLTPQPIPHNPYPSTVSSPTAGYNNTQDSLSLKMGEAMEYIKQIDTLTQAQQILEELCKLGYDDILNIILKN